MTETVNSRARRFAVAVACWVAFACGAHAESRSVTVTYLANEGFLLTAGDEKVLVDALFPGITHYSKVPAGVRSDLLAARSLFDGVDVVLATHHHGDHFGAEEVLAFLDANRAAVFVSTPQAVERLRAHRDPGEHLLSRLRATFPAEGRSSSIEVGSIRVEMLNLHHGRGRRPPVQNLGFVIDLGAFRILHIGDTEASLEDFAPYDLASRRIDLALLPAWFLTEPGWTQVARSIAPRANVAMHLAEPTAPPSWFGSAGSLEGRRREIENAFPEAWIPTRALESREFQSGAASP